MVYVAVSSLLACQVFRVGLLYETEGYDGGGDAMGTTSGAGMTSGTVQFARSNRRICEGNPPRLRYLTPHGHNFVFQDVALLQLCWHPSKVFLDSCIPALLLFLPIPDIDRFARDALSLLGPASFPDASKCSTRFLTEP